MDHDFFVNSDHIKTSSLNRLFVSPSHSFTRTCGRQWCRAARCWSGRPGGKSSAQTSQWSDPSARNSRVRSRLQSWTCVWSVRSVKRVFPTVQFKMWCPYVQPFAKTPTVQHCTSVNAQYFKCQSQSVPIIIPLYDTFLIYSALKYPLTYFFVTTNALQEVMTFRISVGHHTSWI